MLYTYTKNSCPFPWSKANSKYDARKKKWYALCSMPPIKQVVSTMPKNAMLNRLSKQISCWWWLVRDVSVASSSPTRQGTLLASVSIFATNSKDHSQPTMSVSFLISSSRFSFAISSCASLLVRSSHDVGGVSVRGGVAAGVIIGELGDLFMKLWNMLPNMVDEPDCARGGCG